MIDDGRQENNSPKGSERFDRGTGPAADETGLTGCAGMVHPTIRCVCQHHYSQHHRPAHVQRRRGGGRLRRVSGPVEQRGEDPAQRRPLMAGHGARNTARSRLRRASDTLPLDEEAVIVDDRTPEATLERREQAVRVRMALLSLNPVDREVFLRFYYYYQKTADIAADMGLNESTVRTKLNRGRAKLRDFLLREDNHDETEKGGAAWNTISMI